MMGITSLGKGKHIRNKIGFVAESKELSCAAKSRHDLIADHQNAVFVTQLTDTYRVRLNMDANQDL
jgi:hypothetical protein